MSAFESPRLRQLIMLACFSASLAAGSSALAQRAKRCDAADDESTELIGGRLALGRVLDPKNKEMSQSSKDTLSRQAVGSLGGKFNPAKEFGRDYYLAEALVLLAANPNTNPVGSRGSFGYKQDTATTVDILATADTLLMALVKGKPDCGDQADAIRQQAYVPLTNTALGELNAKNYGHADTLALRAVSIYQKSPYVYAVLGGVGYMNKDYPGAKQAYQRIIIITGTDTAKNMRALRSQALRNLAAISDAVVLTTPDSSPSKKAAGDSAVAAWKAFVQAEPGNPDAQAGLTHALQVSGDTAAANQLFADMLNNASKYSAEQIFQSAANAARDRNEVVAVKLFQLGLKANPYYREALYYVANIEFNKGQIDSLMPTVRRLVSVDPNGVDDYRLLAGAYQIRQRNAKDPKVQKAMADSILQALYKFQQPKVGVVVTTVEHDGDHMRIAGRIENKDSTSHTYTPKFSFLDINGEVVGSKDGATVTVGPKQIGMFDITADIAKAVSYKYAPLD